MLKLNRFFACISLLIALLISCGIGKTIYNYSCSPLFGENFAAAGFRDKPGESENRIYLTFNQLQGKTISGEASVNIITPSAIEQLSQAKRINLRLKRIDDTITGQSEMFELKVQDSTSNYLLLKPAEELKLTAYGSPYDFPLDSYSLGFKIEINYQINDKWIEFDDFGVLTRISVPNLYRVEKQQDSSKISRLHTLYREPIKIASDEMLFVIDRPDWVVSGIFTLLAFLLVPLVFTFNAEAKSLSVDLIATILSIAAIRAFLVGNTTNIFNIDLYFVIIIGLIGVISLTKIAIAQWKKSVDQF